MARQLWAACVALGACGTAAAEDGLRGRLDLSATTGASVAITRTAASKTTLSVTPINVRARRGPAAINVVAPYLQVDGFGRATGPNGEALVVTGRRKGFGDVSVGVTYTAPAAPGGLEAALTGRVKLATAAKSSGLGAGEVDTALGLELALPLGDLTPFASLGYRFFGDPAGVDLRNGAVISVGASLRLGDYMLIVSHDYARASVSGVADNRDLFAALSAPISNGVIATGFVTHGLSEASPDIGYGLMLTTKLN